MTRTLLATILGGSLLTTTPALADPEAYVLDPSHSQIIFSYDHLGFSTTYGMFSGFEGEIAFDADDPENSSVSVSMPLSMMFTGWEKRDAHFMSADFFDAANSDEQVTFVSTAIALTGENTADITGDLTLNGITKAVTLDATLNKVGEHPMAKTPWAGFDATTTLLRSDFGVGNFAPFVSDEVQVMISIEAQSADDAS